MSDLTQFRDHCRKMAKAEHKPECVVFAPDPPTWILADDCMSMRWVHGPPKPTCPGCVTNVERVLFEQLAGEVDAYLAPQPDLFGGVIDEPEGAL